MRKEIQKSPVITENFSQEFNNICEIMRKTVNKEVLFAALENFVSQYFSRLQRTQSLILYRQMVETFDVHLLDKNLSKTWKVLCQPKSGHEITPATPLKLMENSARILRLAILLNPKINSQNRKKLISQHGKIIDTVIHRQEKEKRRLGRKFTKFVQHPDFVKNYTILCELKEKVQTNPWYSCRYLQARFNLFRLKRTMKPQFEGLDVLEKRREILKSQQSSFNFFGQALSVEKIQNDIIKLIKVLTSIKVTKTNSHSSQSDDSRNFKFGSSFSQSSRDQAQLNFKKERIGEVIDFLKTLHTYFHTVDLKRRKLLKETMRRQLPYLTREILKNSIGNDLSTRICGLVNNALTVDRSLAPCLPRYSQTMPAAAMPLYRF